MNSSDAQQALNLLRQVVDRARDDSALQNWGVIWMVHGVTNTIGFITTHFVLAAGIRSIPIFLAVWMGVLGFNSLVVFLVRERKRGGKSFVEKQIWSIWLTFLVAVFLVAAINHMLDLEIFLLMPVIAILGASATSMMGALVGPALLTRTICIVVT